MQNEPDIAPADEQQSSENGSGGLLRLAELAESFGAERIAADARTLAERVAEGRFYVACVGQFKRGKSTLLDAMIGQPILPTGIIPVTTVPTVLRYGTRHKARVRSASGKWTSIPTNEIEQYVSEEHNPENAKGVTGVEVFVDSALLTSGMCFVDTPGIGSVFAGNTAATHEFIPHIDAAIVLIGADPPISGDELAIVETVAGQVSDLLFVLNKADRVTAGERDAATVFARKMIESRLGRPVETIYQVSAVEQLEHRGPERDWSRLIHDLEALAEHSGRNLTLSARNRGLQRIAGQLLHVIHEEQQALTRPLEDSECRMAALQATISDAERSMLDLGYLLIAEQHRLSRAFAERRNEFLRETRPIAQVELTGKLQKLPKRTGPAFRRDAMRIAQEIARRTLGPWLAEEQAHADQAFRQAVSRFVEIGNNFLGRLAETGVPELAEMPRPLDAEQGSLTRSRFYFHEFIELARPASPLRFVADAALGAAAAYEPIKRDAHEFLDRLLETNAMRVQSDFDKRIGNGKSRLEANIRILLHDVSAVAQRALNHAQQTYLAGGTAVNVALSTLSAAESEVVQLREAKGNVLRPL